MRSHSSRVNPEPVSAISIITLPSSRLLRRRQRPTIWHRVHRVQHQVRQSAVQQVGVGSDCTETLVQLQLAIDRRAPRRLQLRLEQLRHPAQEFIHLHRLQLRMRHLRKLAEAANDCFQVRNLSQQSAGAFAEHFIELLRALRPRAHQIFDRKLQREQRILQLVRQSPRQFAPGRHSLRLHQAFFLRQQFRSHAIERLGQLREFIAAVNLHLACPICLRQRPVPPAPVAPPDASPAPPPNCSAVSPE